MSARAQDSGRRLRGWSPSPETREALAVFVVAALLLFPGFSWGIPMASGPAMIRGWDVDGVGGLGVLSELNHLKGGAVQDWYVAYPLLHYLVQGALYVPYVLWLFVTGGLQAPSPAYPFGLRDPVAAIATMHLISRTVAVLMGAGTVAFAYATVRRTGRRLDALVAALVILLAEPLVFYSHTGNLDVPVLFWCAAALFAAGGLVEHGLTRRSAIVTGALAGVAIATKDQAYAVMVPALGYVAWRALRAPGEAGWRVALGNVALIAGSAAVALLVCGGVVVWPRRFVMHVQYMLDFERSFANVRHPTFLTVLRPRGLAGIPELAGDLLHAMREGVGLPLLVLGAAGAVVGLVRRPLIRLVALGALGTFVLSVLPIRHMQYRYALFPIWALAIAVGAAGVVMQGRRATIRVAWYGTLFAALAFEGIRAVDVVHQQRNDARYAAGEWARGHMLRGDEVGYFGGTHQLPHLPAGVTPHWLFGDDPGAVRMVYERQFRWMVVAADYFSAEARDHSAIMPDTVWRDLNAGRGGYRLAAWFATPSLIGRAPYYLPYLNSPVRIYERIGPPTAPRREGSDDAPPF